MLAGVSAVNSNVNFGASSWYNRFFKSFPNKDINNPAKLNKLGKTLASPHYNRLALGAGAIMTQPAIDRYNPKVDKDTAKAAMYRTIAKIIACTAVGFCVRGACYKLTNKFANLSKAEGSTVLTPKAILEIKDIDKQKEILKIHKNGFSTIFALAVMVFTNFFLDAPLTTLFSNYLIKHDKTLTPEKEAA